VCAIGMVIRDVVFDETAQVSLVEDEYVIQKIPATASDPAFRHTICQGLAGLMHSGRDKTPEMPPSVAVLSRVRSGVP